MTGLFVHKQVKAVLGPQRKQEVAHFKCGQQYIIYVHIAFLVFKADSAFNYIRGNKPWSWCDFPGAMDSKRVKILSTGPEIS